MAKRQTDAEFWGEQDERRRQFQEIFARMQERLRLADEREERRRERIRRLTFGLLGRPTP
jgi:hypothetical protein